LNYEFKRKSKRLEGKENLKLLSYYLSKSTKKKSIKKKKKEEEKYDFIVKNTHV
jgi:hypothetical protein